MKKLLSLVLAVLTAAAFSSCSGQNAGSSAASASSQSAAPASSQSAASSSSSQAAADDSWSKVESAKQLVLGLDDAFPPMGYVDTKTGEIVGFDIDVAKEACSRLGIKLKLQPIDWDNKSVELTNGNIDCIWNGFSKTEEREKEFNLSSPYMQNHQIILVKADSTYKGLSSLKGKTVGVQADSSAQDALDKNADFKGSLKEVVEIGDYSKAVLEIQNGTIDAIAIDEVVARFYLKNDPGAYRILEDDKGQAASLAVEDYVIGFRKADNTLKAKIEDTLKAMASDGKLTEISKKWFGEDVTVAKK